jgi:hypothetical protein
VTIASNGVRKGFNTRLAIERRSSVEETVTRCIGTMEYKLTAFLILRVDKGFLYCHQDSENVPINIGKSLPLSMSRNVKRLVK